jgi:branched-chain amino acid transport system permease protein
VLVNQATGLINFAQGGMAVLSAYLAWALSGFGIPLILAILAAVVISFFLGALIERYLICRFERGDPDTAVVVTIGLLTLITGLCAWIWTYNNRLFPSLFPLETIQIAGAVISIRSLGTIIVIVVIMGLMQALFLGTKLGLALRAVAINPASAPQLTLTPGMMDSALVYALAACILGGLSSPIGVVVAAWLIGVLENLAAVYIPFIGHDLKIAVPFILIFVVLLVRPQGLFGRKAVVRV